MMQTPSLTYRRTLALAMPIMLANISTPLIGIVDTGVVGHLPDPAYIGAVALGALIFTFIFWSFGFLRMGTSGLAAQAFGANDDGEITAVLVRALLVAGIAGCVLVALQWPLRVAALGFFDATEQVELLARSYFDIRIWAAPVTLANYALLGWFVGIGRMRTVLLLQLVLNVTNIVLDAVFVLVLQWDVAGVAAGTVMAEVLATVVGLALAWRVVGRHGLAQARGRILVMLPIRRMAAVNRDLMLRSLALVFIFVWFMAEGAKYGEIILAANAVLMHLVSASAYILDGLAHTAESLVGRAVGAAKRLDVLAAVRITTTCATVFALAASIIIALAGTHFIDLMTIDAATRSDARRYLPWAALAPVLGVWAYQLDGIFIGATRTAEMRRAMLASLAVFGLAWWLLRPLGNHGLWAALSLHYIARVASLLVYYPRLIAGVPEGASKGI